MKDNNIIDFDKNKPHLVAQCLCLNILWFVNPESQVHSHRPCFNQYVSVFPEGTDPKKLQCPKCFGQDSFSVIVEGK